MEDRFCPGCGAPLEGDRCIHCGTSFARADAPAPEEQHGDPLLDPYAAQVKMAREMGAPAAELQTLEEAFAQLQQARRDAPDDAAFGLMVQPLAAEFSRAAAAAMTAAMQKKNS